MSYHADILQMMPPGQRPQHREAYQNVQEDGQEYNSTNIKKNNRKLDESPMIKKENVPLKKEDTLPFENDEDNVVIDDIDEIDEIIIEEIDKSPWALAMDKYLDKDLNINLDVLLDEALIEIPDKKERVDINDDVGIKSCNEEEIINLEDYPGRLSGFISVIQGPELAFSTEENNFLQKNNIIHKEIARRSTPINLQQARVAHFLGKLSMDGMMTIIAGGRKAQNFYHYMTMSSQPFFNELTVRQDI